MGASGDEFGKVLITFSQVDNEEYQCFVHDLTNLWSLSGVYSDHAIVCS